MFLRHLRDLCGIARRCGVITAHKPLKFGEFIDHFRTQIGLGNARGGLGRLGIRTDGGRKFSRQRRDPRDAFALRAQFVMERNGFQRVQPACHTGLGFAQVVFPKELRIRQPRGKNLLVALEDRRAVIRRCAVGHGDKPFDLPRRDIADGKKLLMLFHRGLQHLGRQVEELGPDFAHQRHRPFDKPRHLGQKARILDHFEARSKGKVRGLGPDRVGAFLWVQDHMRALELFRVILEGRDRKPPRRQEAVAFGGVARRDAVNVERHNRAAVLTRQDAQDRMQWPHPAQRTGAPAHRLGPREIADGGVQHLGHDFGGGTARFFDHGKEHVALGGFAFLQLFAGQSRTAQEAFNRLFRRIHARAFALLAQGGAGLQQALHRQRQTARRRKCGGMGIGQTGLHQTVGHALL